MGGGPPGGLGGLKKAMLGGLKGSFRGGGKNLAPGRPEEMEKNLEKF